MMATIKVSIQRLKDIVKYFEEGNDYYPLSLFAIGNGYALQVMKETQNDNNPSEEGS